MKSNIPPSTMLLRNKLSGAWSIERFAVNASSGALIAPDPPEPLGGGGQSVDLLAGVLAELKSFANREPCDPADAFVWTRAESDRFDRDHRRIAISLLEGVRLRISPMRKGSRGGHRGAPPELVVYLNLPASETEFKAAVELALERSS